MRTPDLHAEVIRVVEAEAVERIVISGRDQDGDRRDCAKDVVYLRSGLQGDRLVIPQVSRNKHRIDSIPSGAGCGAFQRVEHVPTHDGALLERKTQLAAAEICIEMKIGKLQEPELIERHFPHKKQPAALATQEELEQ